MKRTLPSCQPGSVPFSWLTQIICNVGRQSLLFTTHQSLNRCVKALFFRGWGPEGSDPRLVNKIVRYHHGFTLRCRSLVSSGSTSFSPVFVLSQHKIKDPFVILPQRAGPWVGRPNLGLGRIRGSSSLAEFVQAKLLGITPKIPDNRLAYLENRNPCSSRSSNTLTIANNSPVSSNR